MKQYKDKEDIPIFFYMKARVELTISFFMYGCYIKSLKKADPLNPKMKIWIRSPINSIERHNSFQSTNLQQIKTLLKYSSVFSKY